MKNKVLPLFSILLLSSSVLAMDETEKTDKSGHTIHVGFSKLSGDLSDVADDSSFSFGYDYTTKNGVIFGGYYVPELLSVSASYAGIGAAVESSVLGAYSGYQFDNDFRLTAGLSFTHSEAAIATYYTSASDDETNIGLMLGGDYLINKKILIGGRLSTHDVGGVDGVSFGLNAGYKF